jgi:hypothetical protein
MWTRRWRRKRFGRRWPGSATTALTVARTTTGGGKPFYVRCVYCLQRTRQHWSRTR